MNNQIDTSTPAALAEELLGRPFDELDEDEQRILRRVLEHDVAMQLEPDERAVANRTFGDRLADKVAASGGSWSFIIAFLVFMSIWMAVNTLGRGIGVSFDEYPFILLNLALSTLAALQAPVILMSQNRQEQKDRISNRHDYEVNLRTTVEILLLHRKIDSMLNKMRHLEHEVRSVAHTANAVARNTGTKDRAAGEDKG